jgi:hypothetical protein
MKIARRLLSFTVLLCFVAVMYSTSAVAFSLLMCDCHAECGTCAESCNCPKTLCSICEADIKKRETCENQTVTIHVMYIIKADVFYDFEYKTVPELIQTVHSNIVESNIKMNN